MGTCPRPLFTCRIRPDPTTVLYCRVRVWPTLAAFRAARRADGYRWIPGTLGTCNGITVVHYSKRGRARKRPIFAEIDLYRGRLTAEVIYHESSHAACAWLRRQRIDTAIIGDDEHAVSDTEEMLCHATSYLGAMCMDRLRRARLL